MMFLQISSLLRHKRVTLFIIARRILEFFVNTREALGTKPDNQSQETFFDAKGLVYFRHRIGVIGIYLQPSGTRAVFVDLTGALHIFNPVSGTCSSLTTGQMLQPKVSIRMKQGATFRIGFMGLEGFFILCRGINRAGCLSLQS